MYYHLTSSLPNDMLTKVDRMSMSHALETRVPFLDHRLVNMMIKVSSDVKMPCYKRKHVMRKAMRDKLPQAIWAAKKKGFAVPLSRWFGSDDALQLAPSMPGLEKLGISMSWITDLLRTNRDGGSSSGNFLWMLMVLERWMGEKSAG
jgi:asparagine synthase (glutamine-hydrolysing)